MPDTIRIRGMTIRADYRSGMGVPLVLCAGWGANLEVFDELVDTLAGRAILRVDIPGTSGSTQTTLPVRMPYLAAIMETIWDHYGLQRVDCFGHAWGGTLAQELARRNPRRLRRLILAATGTGQLMVPPGPGIMPAFLDHRWLTRWQQPSRLFEREFACRVAPRLFGGEHLRHNPTALLPLLRKLERPSSLGLIWQALSTLGWTSLTWLHRLTQPTLILAGRDDRLVHPLNALVLRNLIPGARLQWLPGGHLFPILDDVPQTTSAIETFTRPEDKVIPLHPHARTDKRRAG